METNDGPLTADVSDSVDGWAKDDVRFVLTNGFMIPGEKGMFYAARPITREDFCVLFAKFLYLHETEENANSGGGGGNSGSSGGGSPSGNGGSSDPGENTAVSAIQRIYTGVITPKLLDTLVQTHPIESQQIVSAITTCLSNVLADEAAGDEITSDYVRTKYAADIQTVKTLWNGLDNFQQTRLQSLLLSYMTLSDAQELQNYFFPDH
jgi:hypothetical protein